MSDEELLYLFIAVQNQWAFDFLYQKYQKLIVLLTRKNFLKFFTVPLELSDLDSISYLIFYQSICCFQFNRNKSFKNFLLTNLNWELLKYLKKYISRNHQILNLAVDYQDYFVWYDRQVLSFNDNNLSDLKLSFYEKNVLKLKYQGYCNREIMKKLNLNYKQIDNAFQRAILKFKRSLQC